MVKKENKKGENKKARNNNTKEELKKELEELKNQLAKNNDKYLRINAEFDNYRKRTIREKMDMLKTAGEKILINILPVIDNMERAKNSISDSIDPKAIKEGLDLIYNNFIDFLNQHGIAEIDVLEKDFDTDTSEAITKIPAPSEDLKGKVIDCTEKGYMLHDKVIRYAKVVVGE